MISLAMDTAGRACSACIYDGEQDRILSEQVESMERGHAERLMGIITATLEAADVKYDDLDRIITTIGPGSFTGIRVAIATARGFALGLNIPVVGISNLEAMLAGNLGRDLFDNGTLAGAFIKAGRDGVYCQFTMDTPFGNAGTPLLLSYDAARSILDGQSSDFILCGDAVPPLVEGCGKKFDVRDTSGMTPIAAVAMLGASRDPGTAKAEPLYLRKPDAKPQAGFAVERL